MNRNVGRGIAAVMGGVGLAMFAGIGIASAHIEPDPAAVEGGQPATVGFSPEHGCEGSPTSGIDMQIPPEITDAQPVAKEGWDAVVDGNVIRFSGGLSPDPEGPDKFSITFTAPTTPGLIYFPTVQTCAEGSADWLGIPVEGGAAPDGPAPAVLVTDGPPTAEDLAGGHDEEATATDDHAETATSEAGDHDHAEEATTTSSDSSDDDSNTGVIIVVVLAAAAVVGGGGYLAARSRRNRSSS